MSHKIALNEQFKRRRPLMLCSSSSDWKPRAGLIARGKGVNIIGAWDISDSLFEELKRKILIAQDCFYVGVDCVQPRAKGPCIEWQGLLGEGPWRRGAAGEIEYGLIQIDRTGFVPMHQLAFRIAGNPLYTPKPGASKYVLAHTCDNKKCCNAEHLSWKTYAQNAQDIRISKAAGDYTETPYALAQVHIRAAKQERALEPTTVEEFFAQYKPKTASSDSPTRKD